MTATDLMGERSDQNRLMSRSSIEFMGVPGMDDSVGWATPGYGMSVYPSHITKGDLESIRDDIIEYLSHQEFEDTFLIIQRENGSLFLVRDEHTFDDTVLRIGESEVSSPVTVHEVKTTRKAIIRRKTTVEEL
jgi:hypothetical protein